MASALAQGENQANHANVSDTQHAESTRRSFRCTSRCDPNFAELRQQALLSVFAQAIRSANVRSALPGGRGAAAPFLRRPLLLAGEPCALPCRSAGQARSLARDARGLAARLALRMNRALRRKGTFWADRFHSRELLTTAEVRRALVYVLANHRKHLAGMRPGVDPFSSGIWFRDWRESSPRPLSVSISPGILDLKVPAVAPAQTWLLGSGWKRHGPIVRTKDLA